MLAEAALIDPRPDVWEYIPGIPAVPHEIQKPRSLMMVSKNSTPTGHLRSVSEESRRDVAPNRLVSRLPTGNLEWKSTNPFGFRNHRSPAASGSPSRDAEAGFLFVSPLWLAMSHTGQ